MEGEHKGSENLIPLMGTSKEEQRIRSMGGKANKNNPKSILAAKLREMKKRGMNDADALLLYEMMDSSELAAMHIMKWLVELQKTCNDKEKNSVTKTIIDWYKLKHGTAESNKKITIDINILTPEEREKEVLRLITLV